MNILNHLSFCKKYSKVWREQCYLSSFLIAVSNFNQVVSRHLFRVGLQFLGFHPSKKGPYLYNLAFEFVHHMYEFIPNYTAVKSLVIRNNACPCYTFYFCCKHA